MVQITETEREFEKYITQLGFKFKKTTYYLPDYFLHSSNKYLFVEVKKHRSPLSCTQRVYFDRMVNDIWIVRIVEKYNSLTYEWSKHRKQTPILDMKKEIDMHKMELEIIKEEIKNEHQTTR